MLQSHRTSDKSEGIAEDVELAIDHIDKLSCATVDYLRKHQLAPGYIDLIESLWESDWLQFREEAEDCLRYGHTFTANAGHPTIWCLICTQLWHMWDFRALTEQKMREQLREEVEAELKAQKRTLQSIENPTPDEDRHRAGTARGDGDSGRVENQGHQDPEGKKVSILQDLDDDRRSIETEDGHSDEANQEEVAAEFGSQKGSADSDTDQHDTSDLDNGSSDRSESEPSEDEDDIGFDPDSVSLDDENAEDNRPPIQKLSSELLTSMVSSLDPPSAVCFALTCRRIYAFVIELCQADDIWDICPVFQDRKSDEIAGRASLVLQPYVPRDWVTRRHMYSALACKILIHLFVDMYGNEHGNYEKDIPSFPRSLLTPEYTWLRAVVANSKTLPEYTNECHILGHIEYPRGAAEHCMICTQKRVLESCRPGQEDYKSYLERVEKDCYIPCPSEYDSDE